MCFIKETFEIFRSLTFENKVKLNAKREATRIILIKKNKFTDAWKDIACKRNVRTTCFSTLANLLCSASIILIIRDNLQHEFAFPTSYNAFFFWLFKWLPYAYFMRRGWTARAPIGDQRKTLEPMINYPRSRYRKFANCLNYISLIYAVGPTSTETALILAAYKIVPMVDDGSSFMNTERRSM